MCRAQAPEPTRSSMSTSVRYPAQFEIYRLEALGDPAYLGESDARGRYDSGKSVRVVPEEEPPSWFLLVAPQRYRFTVTYYTPTRTPLRTAIWERDGDDLLCRRTTDLFYPDGDPSGTVPSIDLVSVTRHVSADGVVRVTLSSPIDDDEDREVDAVELASFRMPVPSFGNWDALVSAAAPSPSQRFGLDAIDDAIAAMESMIPTAAQNNADSSPLREGWRSAVGERRLLQYVDSIVEGTANDAEIPKVEREAASILPLGIQADPTSDRSPAEERRRMADVAAAVRDALENREGPGIAVDLEERTDDSRGSYLAALRAAGATAATWWEYRETHGAVLVWSGDEQAGTLALALHIVPVAWVSGRRASGTVDDIDVRWSSVDLARHATPAPPDSLETERREGEN